MTKMYFLTEDEQKFFTALCETVVPEGSDPKTEPGAITVGALSYIDSHLYGLPQNDQKYFRTAIELLDKNCSERFSKKFAELESADRDFALKEFYFNPLTRERMFDLRSIVLESFYSDFHDPAYNGMTAWGFVEFKGKRISDIKKDWTFLQVWKDRAGQ
jgi:Gluconate 2-dehydrogenase subunit 3